MCSKLKDGSMRRVLAPLSIKSWHQLFFNDNKLSNCPLSLFIIKYQLEHANNDASNGIAQDNNELIGSQWLGLLDEI